jgi:hypothetical protein
MFTVRRLVSDRLARSLSCTNSIESMISIVRTTAGVKRWKDIPTQRRSSRSRLSRRRRRRRDRHSTGVRSGSSLNRNGTVGRSPTTVGTSSGSLP